MTTRQPEPIQSRKRTAPLDFLLIISDARSKQPGQLTKAIGIKGSLGRGSSTFPHFENGKPSVLFFSRGRGRGHAIPEVEIARAFMELVPEADMRFVSYGLGAETLANAGFSLIDVGLPDTSPIAEMTAIAGKLIALLDPALVVAHEEFPIPPVARIFDKKVLFITDFFTAPGMYSMGALKFADLIFYIGPPGVYTEPEWVKEKVRYVGPVLRNFSYGIPHRQRARSLTGGQQLEFRPAYSQLIQRAVHSGAGYRRIVKLR